MSTKDEKKDDRYLRIVSQTTEAAMRREGKPNAMMPPKDPSFSESDRDEDRLLFIRGIAHGTALANAALQGNHVAMNAVMETIVRTKEDFRKAENEGSGSRK